MSIVNEHRQDQLLALGAALLAFAAVAGGVLRVLPAEGAGVAAIGGALVAAMTYPRRSRI